MKFKYAFKSCLDQFLNAIKVFILSTLIIASCASRPNKVFALNENVGEHLFIENCAGCHINGGNIIRRNKTLKEKDLKRNGVDTIEKIAKIAREGIGIMDGYEEVLGEKGDQLVANWILKQAQKAWVQG
mgnify:FL=1